MKSSVLTAKACPEDHGLRTVGLAFNSSLNLLLSKLSEKGLVMRHKLGRCLAPDGTLANRFWISVAWVNPDILCM